jgi:hypothetical protein
VRTNNRPDEEAEKAWKVTVCVNLVTGPKQVNAHRAMVLRAVAQCGSPPGVGGRHADALEATRPAQRVGEAIGDRILHVRASMTEARWRAWLRDGPLPRSLVLRYPHGPACTPW